LNSAHVYKRHNFVSKDECVRIPDGNNKYDTISCMVEQNEEEISSDVFSAKCDTVAINLVPAGIQSKESAGSGDSENQPETKERRKKDENTEQVPDKETLSLLYKKELDALAKEAAQTAAQTAYFDALNKKKSELKECISDVRMLLNELTQKHQEFIENYTNELKYMAVDIAEKMILEKISADDTVLKKLVLQNIKAVKNAEWIGVELSERLVGLVDYVKKELELPEFKRINVYTVTDNDDTCRITTDEGTIVSTISVQANNLRKAFKEADED
jgi:flagellar biosynthesis/type III secretory pathway protein FliH